MTDDLMIKIGGEIRFSGRLDRLLMRYLSESHPDLPLTHPVGCLIEGLDLDRVRIHGPQPFRIRRVGEADLSLGIMETAGVEEVVLEGMGLVFDPSHISLGRMLVELGI